MKKLKLGVLGVSDHFVKRIILPLSKSNKVELYGVASRTAEKAKAASEKWGIPKHYSSYEDLLNDEVIDAVYIPLPNHEHLKWIKKSADAKKHIICEKPLTMNVEEALEVINYVKDKNIKVMEAFMYRFHPKWKRAKELIKYGEVGKVTAIHTTFNYTNSDPNNIRNRKECGGGALMDIGCYAVSTACYLLDEFPKRVVSLMEKHPNFDTDAISSGILDYSNARCLFTTSTSSFPQQDVKIYGTSGSITIKIPFNDFNDVEGELIVNNALGERVVTFDPVYQYQLEFEDFAEAIQQDREVEVSLEESYGNMKILDALRKSSEESVWVEL
ncbi:Predicted dehydrogenase [Natronincola peptidivorans]|uniref:Predicted dehydrogenase n=1 Tax=Natronincola peptidivorans TaxID=426128 RepID=A0A1I0DQQ4_9FIRM|nr:Gfo/Idh/MocA family oxidoreductase [Natronincola peptidivorans]SET34884.1 Predicted dehydrogenase [Natronincola peptidivorans]